MKIKAYKKHIQHDEAQILKAQLKESEKIFVYVRTHSASTFIGFLDRQNVGIMRFVDTPYKESTIY